MELLKEDGCIGEKAFHGEKECFFQPFYNVEKKRIWGAEALFRLKDENGNYYNMDQLAAKAEEEGWIAEIDRWVFREACRRIPELRAYDLRGSTSTYPRRSVRFRRPYLTSCRYSESMKYQEVRSAWRSPRCARSGMQRISAAWWNS